MEVLHWLVSHAFDLLQTFVGSGLFFFAYSVRDDTKARRISNLIAINGQHGETWKLSFEYPELERVKFTQVDLIRYPISAREESFVSKLIHNMSVAFRAMKCGEFITLEGLQRDVRDFLSLPVPEAIWNRLKRYQDADFVAFVDQTLEMKE
jgi:hypothetical protein